MFSQRRIEIRSKSKISPISSTFYQRKYKYLKKSIFKNLGNLYITTFFLGKKFGTNLGKLFFLNFGLQICPKIIWEFLGKIFLGPFADVPHITSL